MPRLPVLSGGDLVAALGRLGFEKVRQSGSHAVLRRRSVGCSVPMHREIKRGTLGVVLTQAGVSVDELMAALR